MFKRNVIFLLTSVAISGCFDSKEETNTKKVENVEINEQVAPDIVVTNPVESVIPIVKGKPFSKSMETSLKLSLSKIKASRDQSNQPWDYMPFMDKDKVEMFKQKDLNFNQDYPNLNLDNVRIAIIGDRCIEDELPTGLSTDEYAKFKKQVTLRTSTASLVFFEHNFNPKMNTEEAYQAIKDMRVWYRYTYDTASNKNSLCSKVTQTIEDNISREDEAWKMLKSPDIVGVDVARFAVENDSRYTSIPFCARLLESENVLDNSNDIRELVVDELNTKSKDDAKVFPEFPLSASALQEPLLIEATEVINDLSAQRCLSHSEAVTTLALNSLHLDDPKVFKGVIDEGEVSAADFPPVVLDENDEESAKK